MAVSNMKKLATAFAKAKLSAEKADNVAALRAMDYFAQFEDDREQCAVAVAAIEDEYRVAFYVSKGFSLKDATAFVDGNSPEPKLTPMVRSAYESRKKTARDLGNNLNSLARVWTKMSIGDQRKISGWTEHGGSETGTDGARKFFGPIGWNRLASTMRAMRDAPDTVDKPVAPPSQEKRGTKRATDKPEHVDTTPPIAAAPEKISDAEVIQRFSAAAGFLAQQKIPNQKRIIRELFETFLRSILKQGCDAKEIEAYQTAMLYLGK